MRVIIDRFLEESNFLMGSIGTVKHFQPGLYNDRYNGPKNCDSVLVVFDYPPEKWLGKLNYQWIPVKFTSPVIDEDPL